MKNNVNLEKLLKAIVAVAGIMTGNACKSIFEMVGLFGEIGTQISTLGGSISKLGEILNLSVIKRIGIGVSAVGRGVSSVAKIVGKALSICSTISNALQQKSHLKTLHCKHCHGRKT